MLPANHPDLPRVPCPLRRFLTVTALAGSLLAVSTLSAAAARPPDGRRIYQKQCANCHGAKGEGVSDKYADALVGDWSVTRLARYIGLNMPEDNPETLTAAESEAVAKYVHDAFYSREAQARINPARIELARLTNQQYAIAVADLVGGLTSANAPAGEGRGLSAVYYNVAQRGRFDAAKVVHRGTDGTIDFEFSEGSEARAKIGTAEFSMQWRGAVLADETGDYEFVVRTPNSVRVWINSEFMPAEAKIDVNVSTPQNPDHRVTVRLLAGRRYPIAIDYWALPGKAGAPPPSIALRWKPPHGSERTIPARHLSPVPVKPAFVLATRFPANDSSRGYERSGPPTKEWDEATTAAAFDVANHLVKHVDRLAGTRPGDPERPQKVATLAERFTTAAFRRPLTPAERTRFVTERFKSAPDPETALKRTALLALKSPQFLYVELPTSRPDSRQVAARLSFGLWDSIPDAELERAAAAGELIRPADVRRQAERMLTDPRARAKLRAFFHHWLHIEFVEDVQKDPAAYPDFTSEVIDDLRTSLNLFVDEVAWSEAADFRELLRADYLIANEKLATFYGLPAPAGGDFARVPAPAGERSGVLTHPYLLAALSYRSTTSPIHRGVFLTRTIVGRALKSPPVAVAFNDAEFTPDMSMREKVTKLTRQESCQGCHSVINPLGFSLEWYDTVGRFRREDNGRAIDAVSDYLNDDRETVRLSGARDVAEYAIASERANDAFIEQVFHHVVKQPLMAYGPGTAVALRESFVASGYNLRKLLVEIVTVAALRGVVAPTAALPPSSPPRS
jgi:mono/diheme cytochrome c family protein